MDILSKDFAGVAAVYGWEPFFDHSPHPTLGVQTGNSPSS